ncbi:hypothetical protein F4556_004329 [Kitasatospora gansuensis]|uniref:Uncharacterized protein n=1 Tax=Kitasatospora gansuensis TaxID=258050 RepID=A0A7W7WJN4_9ACTN|nr:hypothetical protein [Kitasatospora gansuensis]MBB4948794.1 hypothetical protein [Kitasatospora gansuensis]
MSSGDNTGERNPFAPPPADAPDQPWQPRAPQQPNGSSDGSGEPGGSGDSADGSSERDDRPQVPPPHPWSPGYQGGWSPQPQPAAPKFDPNDPVQRRSRYALSAGMGGLFCVVLGIPYVALLLGALAAYWGISALRSPRSNSAEGSAAQPGPQHNPQHGPQPVRPQTPAAIGGLVTGGVTILFVLASLGVTLYYQDYVSCVSEALTTQARDSCDNLAPDFLVNLYNQNR